MTSKADDDVYLSQLRDVFDSCDTSGTGYLGNADLKLLCGKLRLEETTKVLGTRLLGEKGDGRVTFDEFKEAFLLVLSETAEEKEDEVSEDSEEELSDADIPGLEDTFEFESESEVSPKYVKDGKKYGRHSRPGTDTEGDLSEGHSLATCQSQPSGAAKQKSPRDNKMRKKKVTLEEDLSSQSSSSGDESKAETFEAEGQLNQSISEMENVLDEASEEEHLRAIWHDLGVGKSGSLTISELAVVCEHIGMEEMDEEELGHLFNKLDEDADGLVSFHEFLRGLFQHSTPATPVPKLTRSASAPRQASRVKLKLSRSASNIEDRCRTPTFFLSSGSGIFPSIDVDQSGFAKPESIIELWDSLNVPQGPEILEYLEFDMNTKINLADLSYVLEQELHSIEEDNATYQAAIATYEHTLHYVKSTQEQANAEINKLKSDLAAANNRISLLVKEGDERHTTLEKSRDRELLEVEQKYQEQVKRLQSEGEAERDNLLHQTSQQNNRLQAQIDAFKQQESELRDNLSLAQKDLERVEKENSEMSERCRRLERQNFRQQKELESTVDLQTKLNEYDKHQLEQLELNRNVVLDESQRFLEEKLKQIRAENQELKDKNDELTMEVEQMRQLLQSARRHLLTGAGDRSEEGESGSQLQRSGSILSDYTKPAIEIQRTGSVSDMSEDDTRDQPRRKLPRTPFDVDADTDTVEVEELRAEIDGLQRDNDELKVEHTREVAKLQRCLSAERLEIQQKYKLEISDLEDTYLKEKELIIKTFTKQKEEMAMKLEDGVEVTLREREKELDTKLKEKLHTQERELERRVEDTLREREELLLKKWEGERKKIAEEKTQLIAKLKTDHKKELQRKLREQAERSARELEEVTSRELSECDALRLQKSEIELRLLREELALQCEQEKLTLTETWQKEKHQLEEEHAAKICNIDNMLSLGANGLRGKLKEDFYALLDRHKEMLDREKLEWQKEMSEQQTTQLQQLHAQEEKRQLQLEEKHKNKIEKMLARERNKLEKTFEIKLRTALENEKKELEGSTLDKCKEEFRKREIDLEKALKVKMQNEKKELEKVIQEKCSQDYQNAKADLERSFKEKFEKMERTQAESSLRAERSRLEEEKAGLKKKLETDLCTTIERRLEVEFASQLRQVRAAFEEERSQLLTRISSLQRELDESQEERDREQRQWKETLEQAKWETRVSGPAMDAIGETDWNGDSLGEMERLQRILAEERTQTKKTVNEWEQQCFLLQADHDTIKQELEETLEKLERLRQEPGVTSQQKRPSLQTEEDSADSERGDNCQDEFGKLVVERDELRAQLEHMSNMLAETNVALSVSGSEHVRELAGVHEHMTEVGKYNDLEAELVATQQRLSESEALVEQRAAETNKLLITSHKDQQRILQELQQQNNELQQRLNQTESLLEEQVNKLRLQMERSARTDILLKELYVENAELVTCLGVSEEREKGARKTALRLDEKCHALQRVLRRVVPAAVC